jgi:hypothetical protein
LNLRPHGHSSQGNSFTTAPKLPFYSVRKINKLNKIYHDFGWDPIDKDAKFVSPRALKKGTERERNHPQKIKLSDALEVI